MTKFPIPDSALAQHTAILGKTGSGKTTTAKLIVEHVVAGDARVCILDPIKSDWWGLISSASGKAAGLPFQILGGPHGHVPLHASAGKAIAGVVASGALPLSIVDMSQFEAGGLQRFFADFAQVLVQKMRGVLYLVVEEAHEFAPKERAGFGAENMSIHYAKRIATAGRSKGIRMIACTQRVQSLHNAILGSCETLVAMRLSAPADQEPVVKWLRSNVADKDRRAEIEGSLGSLSTGTGWVCSGDAKLFELVKFARPWTFDNTKTPDEKDKDQAVHAAPVDEAKLRNLIGDAVKEAERDDPKVLRGEVARLTRELAAKAGGKSEAEVDQAYKAGYDTGHGHGYNAGHSDAVKDIRLALQKSIDGLQADVVEAFSALPKRAAPPQNPAPGPAPKPMAPQAKAAPSPRSSPVSGSSHGNGEGEKLPKAQRAMLAVLAQYQQAGGRSRVQLALLSGYSHKSSTFDNAIGALRSAEYVNRGEPIRITDAGLAALGEWESMPQGVELQRHWLAQLPQASRRLLEVCIAEYPRSITKEELAGSSGYSAGSSTFDNALGRLRSLELVSRGAEVRASEDLF